MARTRTTKKLAQRIDLNYFKRATPFKRVRLLLVILAPLLAVGWLAWKGFGKDSRVYSSGRMSGAHAVLEKQCATCHLQKAREFSSKAVDGACLACHDGPAHHDSQIKAEVPDCAGCHMEHRGRINISATANKNCAECHADLRLASGRTLYAKNIRSLEDGHPQVRILLEGTKDPGTIQLNHAVHMKPIRRGPTGPMVQLDCGDCHRAAMQAAAWPWTYGDAKYVAASVSYGDQDELAPSKTGTQVPRNGTRGREYMAPVKYATACASCHLLSFDKRIEAGVPHDKPQVVHAFLVKKFREYIAAHPADLRVVRDPNRNLPGCPVLPASRTLTPAQWVTERTSDAELLLWNKTCKQCHAVSGIELMDAGQLAEYEKEIGHAGGARMQSIESGSGAYKSCGVPRTSGMLPKIEPARTTTRWLPHARFDHDAHRGFSCTGCHGMALTSKEMSDVLVPGIENCKTCHAPGPDHAESRCFECHDYHDWSKRKEVKPSYTLPGLTMGGR
jgi:hypothetical protein